ncbi:MAG: DUF5675 family protein [Tissierellia bacterium]|nr:DUF5675 family protein [Tissierellia bacterium]
MHKSEWSYKWEKIKSDYEKFIKYHYPDAEDDKIQERLNEIKAKYDALYDFWGVLQRKGIFKTDTFWYFEPFAWVEQMKRVFKKDNKIVIEVKRIKTNEKKTISTLDVDNGAIRGYILERDGIPKERETISGSKKRIKAGSYKFEITTWSNEKKYINTTLRLLNVPGRSGILLHWENTEGWSDGCLLANRNEPIKFSDNEINKDSKDFVKEIVDYVRDREKEIKKIYQEEKVEKVIIITQDDEEKNI